MTVGPMPEGVEPPVDHEWWQAWGRDGDPMRKHDDHLTEEVGATLAEIANDPDEADADRAAALKFLKEGAARELDGE